MASRIEEKQAAKLRCDLLFSQRLHIESDLWISAEDPKKRHLQDLARHILSVREVVPVCSGPIEKMEPSGQSPVFARLCCHCLQAVADRRRRGRSGADETRMRLAFTSQSTGLSLILQFTWSRSCVAHMAVLEESLRVLEYLRVFRIYSEFTEESPWMASELGSGRREAARVSSRRRIPGKRRLPGSTQRSPHSRPASQGIQHDTAFFTSPPLHLQLSLTLSLPLALSLPAVSS